LLLLSQSVHFLNVFLFLAGPEGLEPSTNCSAGSHSIQAELWAQHLALSNSYRVDDGVKSNISLFVTSIKT
jgi:hypothetical protein